MNTEIWKCPSHLICDNNNNPDWNCIGNNKTVKNFCGPWGSKPCCPKIKPTSQPQTSECPAGYYCDDNDNPDWNCMGVGKAVKNLQIRIETYRVGQKKYLVKN